MIVHSTAVFEFGSQNVGGEPQSGAGDLNVRTGRSKAVPKNYWKAHDPYVADCTNLGGWAVGHRINERSHPVDREIDGCDRFVRFVQRLPVLQDYRFEVPSKTTKVRRMQQFQSISVSLDRFVHFCWSGVAQGAIFAIAVGRAGF